MSDLDIRLLQELECHFDIYRLKSEGLPIGTVDMLFCVRRRCCRFTLPGLRKF
jgi:hypothetical protein